MPRLSSALKSMKLRACLLGRAARVVVRNGDVVVVDRGRYVLWVWELQQRARVDPHVEKRRTCGGIKGDARTTLATITNLDGRSRSTHSDLKGLPRARLAAKAAKRLAHGAG